VLYPIGGIRYLEGTEKKPPYLGGERGKYFEQTGDFSPTFAVYPQISTSYPQKTAQRE